MSRRKSRSSPPRARRIEGGFTLLEILVALGIVAVGITAYVSAMSSSIDNTGEIESRTLASWVASNQLTLQHIQHAWPAPGETNAQATQGGRTFFFRETVSTTNSPDLRRIDITVYTDKALTQETGHLFGYLGKPGVPGK
jgi:general secretion pathway protein I